MPPSHTVAVLILFFTAGSGTTVYDSYSEHTAEDHTPHLDYKDPHWCHSPRLTNGEVTCRSPRGGAYRSTLGTRCDMSCDRGYRLVGKSSIQCLANRRWSGTSYCRMMRCHVLPLIPHGRYTCTRGFMVDSRCEFTCDAGYRIEGEHSRLCQHGASWSGAQPFCSDTDPPKIKCPPSRLKVAEPGKLTATVTWDRPTATDTADKSLEVILVGQEPGTDFKEGANVIRYKVYDQARNRAACKFIVRVEVRRCPELPSPLHGYLTCSSDGNNYGATCEYHCDGGYERRGVQSRVCQFDRNWDGKAAECVPMEIKSDVKTTSALLDQFYEKRRLLIMSAPNISDPDYQLQNVMIQKSECGLDLRQVTLIELLGSPPRETGRIKESLLSSEVIEGLRQVFRISRSYFSMVLLDKLGLDRERFITPMASDELFSYIDSFLLDEEERERLELHRDYCD
ncbi:sushi repeat-containing protein SRPX2 [Echeneis naucrates]|uniref:Sushi repeat-containing protein SRPX2 n=1 Tax=Echeneis naucrates TaxID=173247 RepID=A0A665UB33_ECHNA|nr:sushi repeat-containing protein SRPX2 [Echeneis naucrates]XP_029368119.1 sushi repeat-containing protein SRPX2 [Echeneis naucrates]XP_029368120.1 sushi repeat-containing protein SRPX2 [Echeneis naucrates]